jgi:hypothetical protein
MTGSYKILVEKPEGKRPLRRPRNGLYIYRYIYIYIQEKVVGGSCKLI